MSCGMYSIYCNVLTAMQACRHAHMSAWCLLLLFMMVEINILHGLVSNGRGMMGTIYLLHLPTVSWHITRPFTKVFVSAAHSVSHPTPTHTQLVYKSRPHNSPCCPSLDHAEFVMRRAWVRLREILYGIGGLVSLSALVLFWNALQRFCWPAEWPAGSSLLVCSHLSRCFCLTVLMHFVENTYCQVGAVFLGECVVYCWTVQCTRWWEWKNDRAS